MRDNSKAIAKHLHEMGVEFTAQFLQNMDKDASEAIARLTKQRDAYQVTAVEKHDELTRWKKAVEGLTPGGSEFANDPERCAQFIKDRCNYPPQITRLRTRNEQLEAALKSVEWGGTDNF